MNAKRNSTSQEQLTILMSIDDFKQIESLLIEKRIPFSINYMTKQAIEIPIEKIEKRLNQKLKKNTVSSI